MLSVSVGVVTIWKIGEAALASRVMRLLRATVWG